MAVDYTGISFPFRIGVKGGVVLSTATKHDFTHIDESIVQILKTRPNEREMEFEIYSDLDADVFEPNDSNLASLIEFQIEEALERLEERIELEGIEIYQSGSKVIASIQYSVPEFGEEVHTLNLDVGGE